MKRVMVLRVRSAACKEAGRGGCGKRPGASEASNYVSRPGEAWPGPRVLHVYL